MAIKIVRFLPLNWHYLTECDPLPIGDSCFITGANASGKSTLLDAFRFLFFVTTTGFNAANGVAGKRGGRKLVSYIRAANKDDIEDDGRAAFLRTGATVTHVAAELYNEETQVSSVIGVTVAAPALADSAELKPQWWLMPQGHLKDLQFSIPVEGGIRFATLEELRRGTMAGSSIQVCGNQVDAKAKFSVLLGLTANRLGDASALNTWAVTQNNSIAFDPREMGNLDQFIKTLVVPQAPIRTDDFRQLLDNYQGLQKQSLNMELQVRQLKQVLDICDQYKALTDKERVTSIVSDLANIRMQESEIAQLQHTWQVQVDEMQRLTEKGLHLSSQRENIRNAIAAFRANEDEQAITELNAALEQLGREMAVCRKKMIELDDIVDFLRDFASQANNLFGSPVVATEFLDQYEATSDVPFDAKAVNACRNLTESIQNAQIQIDNRLHHLKTQKEALGQKLGDLKNEITMLENGSAAAASPSHKAVKEAIRSAFVANGLSDEPKYLCELLEYSDESWADAAEAYMGYYRFSIVVQPQNFRCAAQAYRKLCRENPAIFGVTLIDTTAFMAETDAAPAQTLAGIFQSKNPYALEYVKYAYARVKLVEDASYPPDKDCTCISKDGMKYAGRGYSRMRPVNYRVIGAQARARRLQAAREELEEAKRDFQSVSAQMTQCLNLKQVPRNQKWSTFLASGQDLLGQRKLVADYQDEWDRQKVALRRLSSPEKDAQRKQLADSLERMNQACEENDKLLMDAAAGHQNTDQNLSNLRETLRLLTEHIHDWEQTAPDAYQNALSQLDTRSSDKRKGLKNLCDALTEELDTLKSGRMELDVRIKGAQTAYNCAFSTSYEESGYASMKDYRASYEEMICNQIPELRHRTDIASRMTETSFADKIVGDLRTNIQQADSVMNAINRFLSHMVYNERIYQFASIKPAVGKEDFFRMIMDRNNQVSDGDQIPIERTAFDHEFSATMQALYEHIKDADSGDRNDEWLDYRNYCQFGVTIAPYQDTTHKSLLKESLSDGSGAEVQVPCYIILAAALVQQYSKTNRLRGDITNSNSLRVMLVDECFDKMDTVNRQAMITFITQQMGLQLIACAPPDKYESVGTLLENVLFVRGNLSEHTRDVSYFTSPSFGLLAQQSAGDNDSYAIDPALFAAVEEQNRSHFAAEEGESDA